MRYYSLLPITLLQKLLPTALWRGTQANVLYLTFDDGPHPKWTPKVLAMLQEHQARATFFIVGEQAERHPRLIEQIKAEGHVLGSHSYKHLDAWRVKKKKVLPQLFQGEMLGSLTLFRPPYGHMSRSVSLSLKENQKKQVMWSQLTGDFDNHSSPIDAAKAAVRKWKGGDVVVFHDSDKAGRSMLLALKHTLLIAEEQGKELKSIDDKAV